MYVIEVFIISYENQGRKILIGLNFESRSMTFLS